MKKTFKKQMAVVFGAIAMIGYLSVRFFPAQEQKMCIRDRYSTDDYRQCLYHGEGSICDR